jgi:hypothetical protein
MIMISLICDPADFDPAMKDDVSAPLMARRRFAGAFFSFLAGRGVTQHEN